MKKMAITFFIACFSILAYGQKIERNESNLYEWKKVVEVNANQDQILTKIQKWLVLNKADNVNIVGAEGEESILYNALVRTGGMQPGVVNYAAQIDIKDQKFRIVCTSFVFRAAGSGYAVAFENKRLSLKNAVIKRTEKELVNLINSLQHYINENDEDW